MVNLKAAGRWSLANSAGNVQGGVIKKAIAKLFFSIIMFGFDEQHPAGNRCNYAL